MYQNEFDIDLFHAKLDRADDRKALNVRQIKAKRVRKPRSKAPRGVQV